jgi:transposase
MIVPSNRVRIMVATKPVDFRKGHDGLAALVKNELHKDPFTGTVFIFRSRKADRLKLIYWDGSGLVMGYNDLHSYCISLSHSVEGFGVSGILLAGGDAIDELVPLTALLLR